MSPTFQKMKGYLYILECADGNYYTGSTTDIATRFIQHQQGDGSNFTRNRLPVKLVYIEIFEFIEAAFKREKQIQGWSRIKKEALIKNLHQTLHKLSECQNKTNSKYFKSLDEFEMG